MNMQIAVRHRSHATWSFGHPGLWWLGIVVLLVLGLSLWFSPRAVPPGDTLEIQPLVHFRDASHDWLMVVDQTTHELVVYDANDGRPVHRLGAEEGLSYVTSIARKGSMLFVNSNGKSAHVLTLPDFQPVALNGR